MKKQTLYIFGAMALAFMAYGCADEEHVDPTADRTGITSLKAYFTTGENTDKLAVDWKVPADSGITDYVIPIPYYYPEESDNTTEEAMKAMKVVATLENNCTIDPPIALLDLTQKNQFTYTDPYGKQTQITISGQMTRSDKCALKSFLVSPGDIQGVIDEDAKTISLVTANDLSQATADVVLSPHATISPDPSEVHDLNSDFQFTVTADNGTSKATYTVKKQVPPKIANGYRTGSETLLFENDMTTLGITDPNAIHPTLASQGSYVVLNLGDGSAPQVFRIATGSKVGTMSLGNASATGAIASDNAGNILVCNMAENGQTLNIYKSTDVTKDPEPFISYQNALGVTIGARLHVQGDLSKNAVITATPSSCNAAVRWVVTDGQVGQPETMTFASLAFWGGLDDAAKVVSVGNTTAQGAIVDYYQSGACQMYYMPDWSSTTPLVKDDTGNAWGFNTAAIDVRDFNNSRYLALFEMGYWPDWGLTGHVYLYDASTPSSVTGNLTGSPALKYTQTVGDLFGNLGYASDGRFADCLITPSADGYFLYIFYTSNTHLSFGCVQVDCIDK
jgi:hypothetical protein